MQINPNNKQELKKGVDYFNKLCEGKTPFELKGISQSRNAKQNRALHLYFRFISNSLNELGMEFKYHGLKINHVTTRYTENIVKEFIWRPIQIALFDIESTTKINTKQINQIIDVITKYFGERGINIQFPSIETLIDNDNR